jgi:hypothetical protein
MCCGGWHVNCRGKQTARNTRGDFTSIAAKRKFNSGYLCVRTSSILVNRRDQSVNACENFPCTDSLSNFFTLTLKVYFSVYTAY